MQIRKRRYVRNTALGRYIAVPTTLLVTVCQGTDTRGSRLLIYSPYRYIDEEEILKQGSHAIKKA